VLRRAISLVTIGALLAALAVSVVWSVLPSRGFESTVTLLGLVAAATGIPAERWAAARELRERAVVGLRQEVVTNRDLLAEIRTSPGAGRRRVYPRLVVTAAELAAVSGAFGAARDADLLRRVTAYRHAAQELNRRLDLTELRMFATETMSVEEVRSLDAALRRPGGVLDGFADQLTELDTALTAR
jgi:hypothetical protein